MKVNFGKGAFRLGDDFDHKDDAFGYNEGADNLLSKVKHVDETDEGLINVAYDDASPKEIEIPDEKLPIDI